MLKGGTKKIVITGLAGLLLTCLLALCYQQYLLRSLFVTDTQPMLNIGPKAGSHFPGLQAQGVNGRVTLLPADPDTRGTVLVVLQSVAENPYCAAQIRQLQQYHARFTASGLSLFILVQDSADALAHFRQAAAIELPVLVDEHALSVKTLGLIDNSGVHPGAIVIDADNTVADTLFLKNPKQRMHAATLLDFAAEALE